MAKARAGFPKGHKDKAAGLLKKVKVGISIHGGDETYTVRREVETFMGWAELEEWGKKKIDVVGAQVKLPLEDGPEDGKSAAAGE